MNILVIGRAKTGTTVISKTIANSISKSKYHLEPKHPRYFLCGDFDPLKNNVVKIIYEHWGTRPRSRNALVHGEFDVKFDKIVFIIRDPRDELISRLLYVIYPWTSKYGFDRERLDAWTAVLKSKERNPTGVSFLDLVEHLYRIYDIKFLTGNKFMPYLNYILRAPRNSHVVRYEAFMQDKADDLQSYLGFSLSKSRDIGELTRTRRSVAFNNWKQLFTAQDVDYFKTHYGKQIEKFGYMDWELEGEGTLNSRIYSDYVKNLAMSASRSKSVHAPRTSHVARPPPR